jgi:hypothetical protein
MRFCLAWASFGFFLMIHLLRPHTSGSLPLKPCRQLPELLSAHYLSIGMVPQALPTFVCARTSSRKYSRALRIMLAHNRFLKIQAETMVLIDFATLTLCNTVVDPTHQIFLCLFYLRKIATLHTWRCTALVINPSSSASMVSNRNETPIHAIAPRGAQNGFGRRRT